MIEEYYAYEVWFREHFSIRDKAGEEIPLVLTPAQTKLMAAVEKQRARGLPIRIGALKARQVHMSVGAAAAVARSVMFLPGQTAQVYAHEHKSTKQLYSYYDQLYKTYKAKGGLAIQRRMRESEGQYMAFDGGGYIEFGSADNVKTGRSKANRYLHLSEYAFWRDASTLMTGLMASVPKDSGTMVIIETTANGAAGDFFDFWQREMDSSGGWVQIFFGWWELPEYTRPLEVPAHQFQESMSQDEHAMMARFRLSLEQVNWRRWVIRTECAGKVDRFRQEYPADPEEAFLTSGRPRFNYSDLAKQPIVKGAANGELEQVRVGSQNKICFIPLDSGALRMFLKPEVGHRYVIGADTAEGIDAGASTGEDPDYSVAIVLDRENGDMVARYRARIHPKEFGVILADLGHVYNDAFLVPEVNNTGIATLSELQAQQYPQALIYHRSRGPDDMRVSLLQEIGWRTTTVTRPQLVSALDGALRERAIYVRDDVTLSELYRFVITAKGKAEAASGAHDDCVIALALAVIGLGAAPRDRPRRRDKPRGAYTTALGHERRDEDDDD
jgi:hypothetical protein